jgi:AcrR family transcriptional regulator
MPRQGQGQPRRPRVDAERNRARLLDAARAAFASARGPVTLEQIARDSGVGIGTLYRHFPTREALVEALYRQELAELCASVDDLLAAHSPVDALRAWMDRFADYVAAKREMADALRAVFATGAVTVSQARQELTAAVQRILDADGATGTGGAAPPGSAPRTDGAAGTLRDDVRAEDIVAMIVGMFTATSLAGGHEQLERMFGLLMDAVRRPGERPPPLSALSRTDDSGRASSSQ